jgi:NADH dehydrogenase FAD-containing subunit
MKHIVILGAGYGGMLAALRLRPQIKKGNARVTLVNAADTFTERIRLHQLASGQTLKRHSISELLHGTGIDFVQSYVQRIDPRTKQVYLADGTLEYDTLIVALGSQVNRDAVAGIRDHAYTLDKDSAHQLRERLAQGGRLLIIGGGLTGIEAAAEFAERSDIEVHLVTRGNVAPDVSPKGREHIRHTLTRLGVILHENVHVHAIHAGYAETSQGKVSFDACLWAGGFKATPIIAASGFVVNENGQMVLRDTLQSLEYDNIFGVGDAAVIRMQEGNPLRMACAVAMPMGCHAADNVSALINGDSVQPFTFAYMLQCISLGRRNGLVQMVHANDAPKERIFTGRFAAFIKESICRFTVFALRLEKRIPHSYAYPKGGAAISATVPHTQS